MEIKIAKTESEILSTFSILRQLRPHLIERDFISIVRRMEKEGFILCYLYEFEVRAVVGFRYMELFSTGKILYVDDLVTDSQYRSRGYGKILLDWLIEQASLNGCKYLELDSGSRRLDAHKFYRRHGLDDIALHFSIPTDGNEKWAEDLFYKAELNEKN